MPLADVGFKLPSGLGDHSQLIRIGPSTEVVVSHYAAAAQSLPAGGAQSEVCLALIDTGASESCIDINVATRLALPVVDVMAMAGVGGAKPHPVFLGQIAIHALGFMQYGRFAGVDLVAGGQVHQVLLGRTFLFNVLMVYDGLRAQVTLASPILPAVP